MVAAIKNLAALFFCYHVLAIAAANFPDGNVLRDVVMAPFDNYLTLTGQLQSWDMFDSKPSDEKFEVTAFVVDEKQHETKVGPIVPGLGDYSPRLVLSSFFYRLHPAADEPEKFWITYTTRLCRAVQGSMGLSHKTLWVDFISYRLRTLDEIRANGVLSKKSVVTRGPVACGN